MPWEQQPELFACPEQPDFPLLVKFIDAASDLSIQVHPDDAYASVNEPPVNGRPCRGKSECWYILHAEPGAKLVLIGDGELRPEIEAKAAQLPADSVLILGSRTDISRLLQAADVFAFPSHFEGLPVTMIEAQAAGLPCVKSDTITDECVVTDLVTSLPITDPALWAEEILKKRGIPRADRLAEIQASGYDISTAAEKLTRFYLNGESL